MSQTNIAITQLAQLGLTERIAQEMQGHPEILRESARQATPEALKQQRESVAKADNAEKSRKAQVGDEGGGGRSGHHPGEKRKAPFRDDAERAPETPWAGNILNIKV